MSDTPAPRSGQGAAQQAVLTKRSEPWPRKLVQCFEHHPRTPLIQDQVPLLVEERVQVFVFRVHLRLLAVAAEVLGELDGSNSN